MANAPEANPPSTPASTAAPASPACPTYLATGDEADSLTRPHRAHAGPRARRDRRRRRRARPAPRRLPRLPRLRRRCALGRRTAAAVASRRPGKPWRGSAVLAPVARLVLGVFRSARVWRPLFAAARLFRASGIPRLLARGTGRVSQSMAMLEATRPGEPVPESGATAAAIGPPDSRVPPVPSGLGSRCSAGVSWTHYLPTYTRRPAARSKPTDTTSSMSPVKCVAGPCTTMPATAPPPRHWPYVISPRSGTARTISP